MKKIYIVIVAIVLTLSVCAYAALTNSAADILTNIHEIENQSAELNPLYKMLNEVEDILEGTLPFPSSQFATIELGHASDTTLARAAAGDLTVEGSSVALSTGDVYTGAHDFGGATSVEIVNGTDPDVDASGEVSFDTNGAGEPNQVTIRVSDAGGDTQYAMASNLETVQATMLVPNDANDTTRDQLPVWYNATGMTFNLVKAYAWSDTDDTDLNLEIVAQNDWSSPSTCVGITIDQNGTGVFNATPITSFTDSTIAATEHIVADFDDADTPLWVKFAFVGWFDADVN